MNAEERNRIISNEFADLMVDYNSDPDRFTIIPNSSINNINLQYSVVHIPVEYMTPDSIYKFGYSAIPSCYGLLSTNALDPSGIIAVRTVADFEELRGQGVLVGFVDTGIDYTNPVFRYADSSSRIISIWDQTIESENKYPKNFYYGSEYNQDEIDLALRDANPLSIVPTTDDIGHGTMLAGIAAGFQIADGGYMGISPDADLVIVKLKTAKPYLKDFYSIPKGAICYQENDIMFGVNYLIQVAKRLKRPIAICIGLGTSQGDHAGRGMLSRYLSTVGETAGTAVIMAAGNEGNRGHHYYGEINPTNGYDNVELNVANNDSGFSMELWGSAPTEFSVEVFAPTGELISRIPISFGDRKTIELSYEDTSIIVDNQIKELEISDQLIIFRFKNPMAGVWNFKISGEGDLPFTFHIWLPIVNFITEGTFFLKPNQFTTITSPGSTTMPITVTAYNHVDQSLYFNASNGYTVLNEVKPEIAAPGVDLYCPTIGNQFVSRSGSSLAAAYTTGIAAMLLEWGVLRGNLTSINSVQLKRILIQGAKRDPNLSYPNKNWGYGILDINTACGLLKNDLK